MADLWISVINLFTIPYTNQDLIFRDISHTMVGEHFQIYRIQIIGKCICETLPGDDMIINPSCSTTPPNHLINLLKKCSRGDTIENGMPKKFLWAYKIRGMRAALRKRARKSNKRAQLWPSMNFSKSRAFGVFHPPKRYVFLEFLIENKMFYFFYFF